MDDPLARIFSSLARGVAQGRSGGRAPSGREVPGYFEPDSPELARYVGWLCERLSEIKVAATGMPLIRNISLADGDLPGSRRDFLPDLILQWAPEAPVHLHGGRIQAQGRAGSAANLSRCNQRI